MVTTPFLALTMAGAAIGFSFLPERPQTVRAVVGVFTYLFTAFYYPGLGPVPFTYSSEVFPLELRMVGMSIAVSTNFFFAGVLTLVVPKLSESMGNSGLLGLFAGLNIVALWLMWMWVPELVGEVSKDSETRRKPMDLAQLFHIFHYHMSRYRQFQREVYWKYVKQCVANFVKSTSPPESPQSYPKWAKTEVARELQGPRSRQAQR